MDLLNPAGLSLENKSQLELYARRRDERLGGVRVKSVSIIPLPTKKARVLYANYVSRSARVKYGHG